METSANARISDSFGPVRPSLCNRHQFLEHLQALHSGASVTEHSVLVLDMDRFQPINAALGHHVGYRVLNIIGRRILKTSAQATAVAHLGNDEFAILVNSIDRKALRAFGQKLLRRIRQTIELQDQRLRLTASIGIAHSTSKGTSAEALLNRASIAGNKAQSNGGDSVSFYSARSTQSPLRRLDLEFDLRTALDAGDIQVVYQPIISAAESRLVSIEALARWRHPELGWIEPQEFIAIAEESGMIAALGERVLRNACTEISPWLTQIDYLSVNIAAQQFEQRNLLSRMERLLKQCNFPANKLQLELTETAFIDASGQIGHRIQALRALGVRIAIDDFGTGYSSLRMLRDIPADALKIDRSFIMNAHKHHADDTITRAVIDIAHSLEMDVIAEGVEREAQLSYLKDARCDLVQGYLLGRPLSIGQLFS